MAAVTERKDAVRPQRTQAAVRGVLMWDTPPWTRSPPGVYARAIPCENDVPVRRRTSCLVLFVLLPLVLVVLFFESHGCGPVRGEAVPDKLQSEAAVVGFPVGIRYFPQDANHVKEFEKDYLESLDRELVAREQRGEEGLGPAVYLAISGGGDKGAYAAGLLNGWSATGNRPQFKLVTGVSTGALIAPFAFLGPAWDERLKSLYTGISLEDVAVKRSPLSAVLEDALADTTPLWRLVEKHITQQMLDSIAAEHLAGRMLLIATTNLDVRRAVIWNITEIAATKSPLALALVRKILIASAAIPGTFPPVMIDVEAGGKKYQEMHVDGCATAQAFVYPAAIRLWQLKERPRTLYIIRNARLDPEWAQTDRRTLPISFRAISSLVQSQGVGDLYTIYTISERDHVDFNLTFIPPTFDTPHKGDFDKQYMRALFDVGYRMPGMGPEFWYKRPPVLVSGVGEAPEVY
jgi:predicted acylesterase/phospholipase RssA